MYPCCGSTPVTFQVVLYPGGDIEVRYKQLSGQTTPFVGIENQTGSDGLRYTGGLANNLAVLYRYPVGVFLTPPTLANIGAPGSTITYALSVTNRTGSSENFDLSLEPGHAWPATLSMAQTGPLAANASLEFDVFVEVPGSASSGDTDQLTVRASSVSTPATYDTAMLTSTASTGDVAVVTLSDVDRVALVDSELHTLLGTVNVGAAGCDFPWRATKTPDGSEVYVSCNYSDSVAVINLASRTVTQHVTGIYRADGIAFSNDGASAFVGSRAGGLTAISQINTQTYAVNSISHGYATRSIAAHPFLNQAYVTSSDGTILVLDTQTFSIVDTIPVTGEPWDVAVSPDGQWVYTGDRQSGVISVIDVQTHAVNSVIGEYNVVTGLDVSPDGSNSLCCRAKQWCAGDRYHVYAGCWYSVYQWQCLGGCGNLSGRRGLGWKRHRQCCRPRRRQLHARRADSHARLGNQRNRHLSAVHSPRSDPVASRADALRRSGRAGIPRDHVGQRHRPERLVSAQPGRQPVAGHAFNQHRRPAGRWRNSNGDGNGDGAARRAMVRHRHRGGHGGRRRPACQQRHCQPDNASLRPASRQRPARFAQRHATGQPDHRSDADDQQRQRRYDDSGDQRRR